MAAGKVQGFEGSVSAQSLVDVLQFQSASRFSGSVVFHHEGREASVHFVQGDVVHAEAGGVRGEAAIQAILGWPTGSFRAHANVATFARTIDKRLDHLLLDCLRRIDEARRDGVAASPPPPAAAPARHRPSAVQKALGVAGTTAAAVIKKGAPLHDPSPEAAALAVRCVQLGERLAAPLGRLLGLGELQIAAISSEASEQLLLFRTQEADLAVTVAPGAPLVETEAAIRRALSVQPAR